MNASVAFMLAWAVAVLALAALAGASLVSFGVAFVRRRRRDRARASSQRRRSYCEHCTSPIRALDLIPVLSWLLLGGRCRDCGASLGFGLVALEIAGALVAALFVWSRIGRGF